MLPLQNENAGMNFNLKYRDYFIDFLACLIPGFVFLVISASLISSTIYVAFKFLPAFQSISIVTIDSLDKIKKVFNYPFWIHVSIFILSYMFGFFLYRQDPKRPDHVSYLKNRNTVKGYNKWVIKNNSGLAPSEVQFPYCNLSDYLKSRGFGDVWKYINWNCDDESGAPQKGQKNRSKAFINKLKMRIAFFYPESISTIIKNEAHIRFSSSSWYAFEIVTKLLYGAVVLLIFYETLYLIQTTPEWYISAILMILNISILIACYVSYRHKKSENKIFNMDHKGDEKVIDKNAAKLTSIYRMFDLLPFIASIVIAAGIYISVFVSGLNNDGLMNLLLLDACYISIISFFVFYAKQKIEVSFHYQRVREIIYVIELAGMSNVLDDNDIKKTKNTK